MSNSAIDSSVGDYAQIHRNHHYQRAIASMGQEQSLVLRDAIYTAHGVKLADKGVHIDHALYDRLMQEHSAVQLEDAVDLRDRVDINTLEVAAMTLCASATLPRLLVRALGPQEEWRLLAPLADMAWPERASFKLTLMRSQWPKLYEHSVTVMLVAIYLGICENLLEQQLADLAAGALLHDVGMLFMDPSWSNISHRLSLEERKQLSVHTITSMMVVRATAGFSAEVEMAVLEHHERMDGSGYPRNLMGTQISHLGRILMVAEVVAAFYEKYPHDLPELNLSLMLRLNHQRFDHQITFHIFKIVNWGEGAGGQEGEILRFQDGAVAQAKNSAMLLGKLNAGWKRALLKLPKGWQASPFGRAALFVQNRMQAVEKSLNEAGSLPAQQLIVLASLDTALDMVQEQIFINREAIWQIESIIESCQRRWSKISEGKDIVSKIVYAWIVEANTLLDSNEKFN